MADLTECLTAALRRAIALLLWREGAVQINLEDPFELTSGNHSPIYVNCRKLISSMVFVDLFSACAQSITKEAKLQFDAVAGGETAGIPLAAFLARSFGKPMLYVRKAQKAHGAHGTVEGALRSGDRILLVEDLVTDAQSKLGFISSLRSSGAIVENAIVILDRLQGGRESLEQCSVHLHSIADMDDVLAAAADADLITPGDMDQIAQYLASPSEWHSKRGLEYKEYKEPL